MPVGRNATGPGRPSVRQVDQSSLEALLADDRYDSALQHSSSEEAIAQAVVAEPSTPGEARELYDYYADVAARAREDHSPARARQVQKDCEQIRLELRPYCR